MNYDFQTFKYNLQLLSLGYTLLNHAAFNWEKDVVKLLLEHEVDVDAKTIYGYYSWSLFKYYIIWLRNQLVSAVLQLVLNFPQILK